jgi:predicted RNase H-like HicB family nuclease
MDIKITKSEGVYTAVIPELHIVDQADTISELRSNLRDAIELTVEYILERGSIEEISKLYGLIGKELNKKERNNISDVISEVLAKKVLSRRLIATA